MTKEFGDWRLQCIVSKTVSTLIALHINGIIKEAAAQSGLMGEDSTRMSDTHTSSIILGLLRWCRWFRRCRVSSNEMKICEKDELVNITAVEIEYAGNFWIQSRVEIKIYF